MAKKKDKQTVEEQAKEFTAMPYYAPPPPPKTTELVYCFLHDCEGRFESAKVEIDINSISLEVKLSNIIPEQKESENEQN